MHAATVAAHPGSAASTASAAAAAPYPPRPLVSYPQTHGLSHPVHVMRPPHHHHHHHLHPAQLGGPGLGPGPGPGPGPVKGIPVSSPQPEGLGLLIILFSSKLFGFLWGLIDNGYGFDLSKNLLLWGCFRFFNLFFFSILGVISIGMI
jgi:hypothetical protein